MSDFRGIAILMAVAIIAAVIICGLFTAGWYAGGAL